MLKIWTRENSVVDGSRVELKLRREDDSITCFAMFHKNKSQFSSPFITMDETWIHNFTPKTKEPSKHGLK